jgi:hypothetical protein
VEPISKIYLFAIGRAAARFQSYGYAPEVETVAPATWRQFVRLRYEVGPSENVFRDIHNAIRNERTIPVKLTPIRQEMALGKFTVVFENLWNAFDDEGEYAAD